MRYRTIAEIEENLKEIRGWIAEDKNLQTALISEFGNSSNFTVVWLVYSQDDITRGLAIVDEVLHFFECNYDEPKMLIAFPVSWASKYVLKILESPELVQGVVAASNGSFHA